MDQALDLTSGSIDHVYAILEYWALSSARVLGATMLFTAFIWGRISSGIIRSVLALALALPVMGPVWGQPEHALAMVNGGYLFDLVKELGLGLLLGFIASLPLEAIGAAGNVIDASRGGGSLPGPGGDNTTFGQLFMVIALWLFASLGGFWRFADMIYSSFGLWPVNQPLPAFNSAALQALYTFLAQLLLTVITLAGPPMALLLLTDVTLLTANRLGKRMNVLDLSMSMKNILLVGIMPLYALVVVRVVTGQFPMIFDLGLLQLAFKH